VCVDKDVTSQEGGTPYISVLGQMISIFSGVWYFYGLREKFEDIFGKFQKMVFLLKNSIFSDFLAKFDFFFLGSKKFLALGIVKDIFPMIIPRGLTLEYPPPPGCSHTADCNVILTNFALYCMDIELCL